MTYRHSGFTLVDLLVVSAIIAILAAMLFPVFARARESARKIQCLSNVKNIALAIQMYLGDYDAFPPKNTDSEFIAYLETAPGGKPNEDCTLPNGAQRRLKANPFLRWPVVLEEYVRNRDVWRCPSARHADYPHWIIPNYTPIWWQYLQQH